MPLARLTMKPQGLVSDPELLKRHTQRPSEAGLLDATIKTYLNPAVYEQDLKAEEEERRRIIKALPSADN